MKLPRRKWFTEEELILEWGIDKDYLTHLVKAFELHPSYLIEGHKGYKNEEYYFNFFEDEEEAAALAFAEAGPEVHEITLPPGKFVFRLEEVERFEIEQNGEAIIHNTELSLKLRTHHIS